MPDTKISQLAELTVLPASDDEFEVRDVSEVASAQNKRITRDTLFAVPAARVRNSANISHATSGTAQAVTFDTERFDTDSIHSTATNTSRLTCNTAGLYVISGCVRFASNVTGRRDLAIVLNGISTIAEDRRQTITDSGVATTLAISTIWKLAATDYVELHANQTSGGALNMLFVAAFSPEFGMTYVGTG
jgi:hypothetical protein